MGSAAAEITSLSEPGVLPNEVADAVIDLPRVEIVRAGDYRNSGKPEITESDLERMAAIYDPSKHDAPVTLDHVQSGPAYGWIKKVWREGKSLFASLRSVPEKMADAIRNGRYEKRSIEYWNRPEGKELKCVSFLGAAVPESKGMARVQLSEEPYETAESAQAMSEMGAFALMPETDIGQHGEIEKQTSTGEVLGHYHVVYVDGEGNGFTSPPLSYGESCVEVESGGHTHIVQNGMLESPDGYIAHTHQIYMGETKPMEAKTKMAETKKPNAGGSAESNATAMSESGNAPDHAAEIARLKALVDEKDAQLKTQGERIGALEKASADAAATVAFNEAWRMAESEGRVVPAEKPALYAIYMAQSNDATVTLAEGKPAVSGRAAILETIKSRAVVVKPGVDARFAPKVIDMNDSEASGVAGESTVRMAETRVREGKAKTIPEAITQILNERGNQRATA